MASRCSPLEAVTIILRSEYSPTDAADRITEAFRRRPGLLFCDDVAVQPRFGSRLRLVAAFDDKKHRWSAEIVSAVGEAWERPVYKDIWTQEVVEGIEVYGEAVYRDVLRTITVKPPYQWEFDVDELVTLLPIGAGDKGGNWETHVIQEIEDLGRKTVSDLHKSKQLRPHLEAVLKRVNKRIPNDPKVLRALILAFLRGKLNK